MSEAEHRDANPLPVAVGGQDEKDSSVKQVTVEQASELGCGSECSEPSERGLSEALMISSVIESTGALLNDAITGSSPEKLALPSEDTIKDSLIEQLKSPAADVSKSNLVETDSSPEKIASGQRHELDFSIVNSELSEHKNQIASESEPLQSETVEISYASKSVALEQLELPSNVPSICSLSENEGVPPEDATKFFGPEQLAQPYQNVEKGFSFEILETSPKVITEHSSPSGIQDKDGSEVLKRKHRSKPLVDSVRVLRPRSQEIPKPPESSDNLVNGSLETQREKKKRRVRNGTADEFVRIRQRLRYLQNKINYERSLIDAYSGEGWKGLSLEKLKPEKELQRATSEILRQKLKIRDVFQYLDSLCAEGRIPESLFDSKGEISSEDIFCAKCGSKDVSLDNDIILCDGGCERAFHQFCLEPPLHKEDIPPGDEGWLCPGCDCKVYCIDMLNQSQGANLSVTDSWEKVFPEAAVTAGKNQDHTFGLPSDDSEDDDYDPDIPETDEKVQEDVTSSDESEYPAASDDLETPANVEQYLGLPSDDSEDGNYDPSAAGHDDKVNSESSSSDFTSDSKDSGAASDDGMSSGEVGRKKQLFVDDELASLLESGHGDEGSAPVSGKRHVERLDYKRLHDETYGNAPTDSSDDEIWTAKETRENVSSDSSDGEYSISIAAPRKRKKSTGEATLFPSNGNARILKDDTTAKGRKHNQIDTKGTSKRNRQKRKAEDTNGSPVTPDKDSAVPGSSGKKAKSSSNRRLGETATQGLYKVFKNNQYPDRATKEKLAAEIGLTLQQVSKWFDNARWSFRHSSCVEPCSAACPGRASRDENPQKETNDKLPEHGAVD